MFYGCIGEKLTHSFSKEIHAKLFDYQYELCEIEKDKLSLFMLKKDFKAINVTIPYKQAVIPFLDEISEDAKEIGAVNTIVNKNGKLFGYNTDFSGMLSLINKCGLSLKDKKVLILGSGGTSKTAFHVAKHCGAAEIYRVSRSGNDGCITYETAKEKHNNAQIIINSTPCGMFPNADNQPICLDDYPNVCGVIDAIYNPLCSKLVLSAKEKGIIASGGLYMLVKQAAVAAEYFTGLSVSDEKTDKVYNEILKSKQNIVLTGMPGAGKTTIGKILAKNLNMDFVDSDDYIVDQQKKQITDIFASVGEPGFRAIEKQAIAEISTRQNTVIATGGGAILDPDNIAALKQNGIIWFIDRPIELIGATQNRPLSSNRADLEKRYNERYSIYVRTADHIIENKLSSKKCAEKIKGEFLK